MKKNSFLLHIRSDQIYTDPIKGNYQLLKQDSIINLNNIGELVFKEVLLQQIVHGKHIVFTHSIEFYIFSTDGIIHLFSLFFTEKMKIHFLKIQKNVNGMLINGGSYED